MKGTALRAGLWRTFILSGGFTLAALGTDLVPTGSLRALAMLGLPFLLLRVLRREERRLKEATRGPPENESRTGRLPRL